MGYLTYVSRSSTSFSSIPQVRLIPQHPSLFSCIDCLYKYIYIYLFIPRESLFIDPSIDLEHRCQSAWTTTLTSIKGGLWGYPSSSTPTPCRTLADGKNDGRFALLFERLYKAFDKYKSEQRTQQGRELACLSEDEYLNAELLFSFIGKDALTGRAHCSLFEGEQEPLPEMQYEIVPEASGENKGTIRDVSTLIHVYKRLLTTLPTTMTSDYEALEHFQQVLCKKQNVAQ